MTNKLILSPNFSMPAVDYAGQGNAILGIRDAGKTYTALKAAEELLKNKIPIICYDPVGIWKNLKVGIDGHKGFPVVVAGGPGSDIILTVNNAVDIVRAAMKENVSLVIDLYSPELINKSTWIRIVQETVDLLMYENKECGLRHIFIEEAAEFIPQRLQPQHSRVYASLERLARMGRNARLGYTLINQRAEEVNKAILEISAMSLLHKQVGKNSLKSIQQWLELMQAKNYKEIIQSLPGLTQGECWVIGMNTEPHKIKVDKRVTFHPNPKQTETNNILSVTKVDVSGFVEKLNKQLVKDKPEVKSIVPAKAVDTSKEENYKKRISDIEAQLKAKDNEILIWKKLAVNRGVLIGKIKKLTSEDKDSEPIAEPSRARGGKEAIKPPVKNIDVKIKANNGTKLGKCSLSILQFLASYPDREFSKAQVGIASGYSPNSGGFNNSISELIVNAYITRSGGKLQVGNITGFDFQPQEYSITTFRNKLNKCEREIYDVLLENPTKQFNKEDLASETDSNYSPNSGGFNNSLSTLNTLELIKRDRGVIQLNPELLEL